SLEKSTFKKNGEIILVHAGCPDGMNIQSTDKKEIVVNRVLSVNSDNNVYLPVKVEFRCISEVKEHLVIVKANESDIPVLLFGKEVGKTGKDGISQIPVKGKEGEEIEITLNTSLNNNILPQMPSRLFQLPDTSRFFLFEQDFVKRKITKKKSRRKNVRKGPVRL
ncbi:MAG: hypothetical protein JXR91_08440, partial [Deltaproteobacteria bacterium]|nr:hypothetical protein [Deltaproteobacteria bacterium]